MSKPKSLVELFFYSKDLSISPLFEEIASDASVGSVETQETASLRVPRSGLPLTEVEEAESAIYGERFIKIVYGSDETSFYESILPSKIINKYGYSYDDIRNYKLDEFIFYNAPGSLSEEFWDIIQTHIVDAYKKLPTVDPIQEAALRYYFTAIKQTVITAVPDIFFLINFAEEYDYENKEYGEYLYSDLDPWRQKITKQVRAELAPYIHHLEKNKNILLPYATQYFGSVVTPVVNTAEKANKYIDKYILG